MHTHGREPKGAQTHTHTIQCYLPPPVPPHSHLICQAVKSDKCAEGNKSKRIHSVHVHAETATQTVTHTHTHRHTLPPMT